MPGCCGISHPSPASQVLPAMKTFLTTLAACMACHSHTEAQVIPPNDKAIFSGESSITIANQYMTRGFIVQDEGISFQPHLDLSAGLYQGGGLIHSASAFVSLWSAIGSVPYDDRNNQNHFTEFDYGMGITADLAKRWTITCLYNRWTSPAGVYEDGHWLSMIFEFRDHELFPGNFSLEPFLQVTHEFGSDLAPGLCFEPGVRPNVIFFQESPTPINAGFLIMAGLGNAYYGVDFGYLAAGPQLFIPLKFIDPTAGNWTASVECLFYDFGETTTAANGKNRDWLVGSKLTVEF